AQAGSALEARREAKQSRRLAGPHKPDDLIEKGRPHILQNKNIPDFAAVYRIHGPFQFGVTDKINTIPDRLSSPASMVILRLRNKTVIHSTGIAELEELADQLQK